MDRLLRKIFSLIVRKGTLMVSSGPGRSFTAGDGTGTPIAISFPNRRTLLWMLLDPELRLGEAYMDGSLRMERGSIADLLDLGFRNMAGRAPTPWSAALRAMRSFYWRVFKMNNLIRSSRNVAHHYDIDHRLYRLFLDSDWQYSCAYFERPNMSIEEAQQAKKRHIGMKLLLDRPGLRVLDIGSGWGGLGLEFARSVEASVMGITLSQEQMSEGRKRAESSGLARQVAFELIDYRNVVLAGQSTSASAAASQSRRAGTIDYRILGKPAARRPDGMLADRAENVVEVAQPFDRIVSVGMFEHVGVSFYDAFLAKCRELIADDGVILLHTIGRLDGPSETNPWVNRYIFPGGYTPALSELAPAIERSGLILSDIEVLRLHYAETLKAWRQRFLAQREQVLKIADDGKPLFDERFLRMWEFYLAGFEPAFRHGGLAVFQIQMTKKLDAVPLTRNYMYESHEPRSARVLKAV